MIKRLDTHSTCFCLLLAVLAALLLFGGASTACAYYDVVIAWDPNYDPDLAGYILYVDDGTTPMPYGYVDTYELDELDPKNPMIKIMDLNEGIAYYFTMTAYDMDGNESDYSDELCVMNGRSCPTSLRRTGSASSGGGGGGGGGACFIDAAADGAKSTVDFSALLWILGTLVMLLMIVAFQHFKRNGIFFSF
jgi:hypothetical protein